MEELLELERLLYQCTLIQILLLVNTQEEIICNDKINKIDSYSEILITGI